MYNKLRFKLVFIIAVITSLTLIVGFIASIKITSTGNTSKESQKLASTPKVDLLNKNDYNILVLGDSLAKGTGDETGKGFAMDFADSWKSKTPRNIKVTNLAVNGDVSSGLLRISATTEASTYIKGAQIIFISIGGNEITRFKTSDISSGTDMKSAQDKYLSNLGFILKNIRAANKQALVVFLGLYNPYGDQVTIDKTYFLWDWNYQTEQLLGRDSKAVFIPTFDLFKYNLTAYLAVDNFHPNSEGYKAIANRILETLKNYK
jgi:lysophospholipase L1-like esterase